jgi:GST-like protein
MGSAPYLGGGFGHFYAYAPTKIEYAIDRFAMETKRQLDVLERRLADNEYLGGSDYTIAARPAVKRGRIVNRTSGSPSEQLHERHDAGDFDTRTQDRIG